MKTFIQDLALTVLMAWGVALETRSFGFALAAIAFGFYLSNIRADIEEINHAWEE